MGPLQAAGQNEVQCTDVSMGGRNVSPWEFHSVAGEYCIYTRYVCMCMYMYFLLWQIYII